MNAGRVRTWTHALAMAVVAAALLWPGAGPAGAASTLSFSIATGGVGGVWYPLGGALGGIITQYVPDTQATAEATTAAIDNLLLLTRGKAGMAFCYDYHAVWINDGRVPGIRGKYPVRVVMGFYEQPLHVVTKEGTGIRSLTDLRGKRVSTGAPNSGTEEQADYVLKALGIDWNRDIRREKLGVSESASALKDGKIDAFFWSGGIPTSAVLDLGFTPGLKMVILPVSGQVADRIIQAYPDVFHKTVFPKGIYPGVDSDIDAIAITAVLTAMEDFPADRLYQILGAIFAHRDELSAVWKEAEKLTPAKAVGQISPEARKYLHAGAQRYFTEQGALK